MPNENEIAELEKLTAEPARILEETEISAWLDLYKNTDEDIKSDIGFRIQFEEGILLSAVTTVDILALNRINGMGLYKEITKKGLHKAIKYFKDSGVPRFFLQLCPAALNKAANDLITESGFTHYSNWVRLYRETQKPQKVETKLKVIKIRHKMADKFGELITFCFGWPGNLKGIVTGSVEKPGWHHYMAFDKEKAVATAAMYIKEDTCWFGMASTLPEYRNKGAQSALIARRIEDAIKYGCRLMCVETAEETPEHPAPSFRNIKRSGFIETYKKLNYIYKFQ